MAVEGISGETKGLTLLANSLNNFRMAANSFPARFGAQTQGFNGLGDPGDSLLVDAWPFLFVEP